MPRSKPASGETVTKRRTGGAKPKASKRVNNQDNDTENDNESGVDPVESKMDRYDATMHDNGDDNMDDNDDWDGEGEDVDVEGDEGDEGDEVDNDADEDVDLGGDIGDEGGDDDCAYNVSRRSKGVKKLGAMIDKEDDDDDEGADINVDENELNPELYVKPEERRAVGHLTQYERVRLLGDRTAQLAQGAKPMIKGVESMDPRTIAQLELESKMIPIKIIRPLPDGKKEIWSLSELKLKKKYIMYGFTGGEVDKESVQKIRSEYQKGGSIIGYRHLTDEVNSRKQQEQKTIKTASKSGSKDRKVGGKDVVKVTRSKPVQKSKK